MKRCPVFFIFPVFFCIISLNILSAQTVTDITVSPNDSLKPDTALIKFNTPLKPMLKSMVIPGWGQYSNNIKHKAALFLAGDAFLLYRGLDLNSQMSDFQKNSPGWKQKKDDRNRYLLFSGLTAFLSVSDVYFSSYFRYLDKKEYKSPKGAMYRSLFFPGWGQFYNRKFIKSAVVFGLEGYFAGSIYHFNKMKNKYAFDDDTTEWYLDRRKSYSWYLGMAILFSSIDAFVDAYLDDFDKDMNISMSMNKNFNNNLSIDICLHF